MYKWLKSTDAIQFRIEDKVARITLNRPDKRNAISDHMLTELEQALLEADDRKDVSVILLDGAGKDFCSGYDLEGAYFGKGVASPDYDPEQYRKLMTTFDDDTWVLERSLEQRLRMFDLHKPIIAKVQGNCLAGGTDLAFLCDIVLAASNARIGFPASRANGTPPTQMWLYLLGPQWAKRLLFTGDCLTGDDAAELGLVLDAYPAEELDEAAIELARRISLVDVEILAVHKRVINFAMEMQHARTLQRVVAEADARAHLTRGPRRSRFREDMANKGFKEALKNRDEEFGHSMIQLRRSGDRNSES